MKKVIKALALVLLMASPARAEVLPMEYFLEDGDYLDVKLAPSGERLAARVLTQGRVVLAIIDRQTNEVLGGVRPDDGDAINSYFWINDERLVFTFAEQQYGIDRQFATGELYAIDYNGKRQKLLAGFRASDKYTGSRLGAKEADKSSFFMVDPLDGDDRHILVIEYPWSVGTRVWADDRMNPAILHRLNVYTGKKRKVEILPFKRVRPLADSDGNVLFVSHQRQDGFWEASYRASPDGEWQDLVDAFDLNDEMAPLSLSRDGKTLFLSGPWGLERYNNLFRFNLETQALVPLFDNLDADITNYFSDPVTGRVVGARSERGKPLYHYADPDHPLAKLHRGLVNGFDGKAVEFASSSQDGKEIMVRVSADTDPGQYYIFNTETRDAAFFWANMSWVDPRKLRPMLVDEIPTDDGLSIPVRLTLPDSDGPAPLIVHPHGGPHGIFDPWGFDRTVQLLANRGYAVLQVNFRGSGSVGDKFEKAGYRRWGSAMIADIATATEWAMQNPAIDRERVCAYGASYGAYASYMLAARYPELLRCTVGYVGVYDLPMMFKKGDIPRGYGGLAYLRRVLGRDEEKLADFSPVNHADRIQAATLLIHGSKDVRAPIEHGEAMRDALRKAGHEVEWVEIKRSAHGAGSMENKKILYSSLLEFLEEHLM
ncbi:MAG: prolyl oligopeptidase family serine peptidase [Pseudomonadota bacterium]